MRNSRHGLWSQGLTILAASALLLGACSNSETNTESETGSESTGDTKTDNKTDNKLDSSTGDLEKLTLWLNWVPNAHHAGIYLAEQNGWYEQAGLDLEIVQPSAEVGAVTAVANGSADIGVSHAEYILPARSEGIDVTAVATLLPTNDSSLMMLADDNVKRPKDLENRTYGRFGTTGSETAFISKLVECDGGDPEKVNFVPAGTGDYLAGMKQDRFDAVWVFEGWDVIRANSEQNIEVDTIKFADHADCIPNWDTPLLFTSGENTTTQKTKSFLEVTSRGYEATKQDPQAGAAALSAHAEAADLDLLEASVAYYAPLYNAGDDWGKMDETTWNDFAEFLVEAGDLENAKPAEGAFTNSALPK